MSNDENNDTWKDISSGVEFDYFGDWINLEIFLGEYKEEEQFSQVTRNMQHPGIVPGKKVPVTFTSYRGDDGKLLGVHIFFIDENGIYRTFVLITHPDHQRKGIATKLIDYDFKKYEEDTGKEFDYRKTWGDVTTTESAANFVNKYVRNAIAERQNR